MAVVHDGVSGKHRGSIAFPMVKSWSFGERIRALRRNLVASLSQDNAESRPCTVHQLRPLLHNRVSSTDDVWRALSPTELPDCANFQVVHPHNLSQDIYAAGTGPQSGLLAVQKWIQAKRLNQAVIESWKPAKNRKAHGLSVSLYEKNPLTGRLSGEPLADAFVYRARRDSAFLAVADGVNWGRESMQAARCAVYSVYDYLETHLYGVQSVQHQVTDTRQAAQLLFETFSAAQDRIVSCTTGLTTLCVALVLPVLDHAVDQQPSVMFQPRRFAVIVASVGDSQAYLLSKSRGIRELTGSPCSGSQQLSCSARGSSVRDRLSHFAVGTDTPKQLCADSTPACVMQRDFRYTGGALGPVYDNGNPELNNLICSVTLCCPGDIVILGSDGLSDNFDPVITQLAVPESPQLDYVDEPVDSDFFSATSSSGPLCDPSTQSRYNVSSISPPPELSIWPRPPPPPILSSTPPSDHASTVIPRSRQPSSRSTGSDDHISACSLNFTNQLEMSWPERRRYAEKAIERVWHEVDAFTASPGGRGGVTSSQDLCEALISEVFRVTARKRELLADPDLARLRMHPDKLRRLNIPLPEDELGPCAFEAQRKWLADTLKFTPGKLDHATVVAYEAGTYGGDENEDYEQTTANLSASAFACSEP